MFQPFDHSLELESIEFFFHRLLQHDRLSFLLEVLGATNVVMRWRKRKRWQFWEWLLVERVLQDRFHALVAPSTGPYGSISSRFHPVPGLLPVHSDHPHPAP